MTDAHPELQAAQLLLQHRTVLHGYIFACVRNHTDAEDIFQEVSMAILKSADQLQAPEGFLAWAREIAFRRVLEHARKSGRETVTDPHVIGALADATVRLNERQPAGPRQVALLECLDRLPSRRRRLIIQRYDGSAKDGQELANRLGLTVQALYAKIKRIKLSLRDCVERRLAGASS